MFGISWEDALKSGKVLNAKEACAKFGVDGNEMENMWGKLDKSKEMIKFGGGFYCGKVGDVFVINGFYMSMRSAYTTPPAKIHYFTVQWPTDSLSWQAFRDEVCFFLFFSSIFSRLDSLGRHLEKRCCAHTTTEREGCVCVFVCVYIYITHTHAHTHARARTHTNILSVPGARRYGSQGCQAGLSEANHL